MINRLLALYLLTFGVTIPFNDLVAQQDTTSIETREKIHLRKKRKIVNIYQGDYFGLTTATDSVKYFGEKIHSYKLLQVDKNSLVLRRPHIYKDTIVASNKLSILNGREYVYGVPFRKDKQYFVSIVLVESYEYKTVPLKSINSIQYPPDAGNTLGCFSCAIIPIYNIFYFIKIRKRWHPKDFPIGKWQLEISS